MLFYHHTLLGAELTVSIQKKTRKHEKENYTQNTQQEKYKMRFELFFKDLKDLRKVLEFYQKNNLCKVNIPCKAKLKRKLLLDSISTTMSRRNFRLAPHFSIAYEFDRTKERTMKKLYTFMEKTHGVEEILLVSGSQKRKGLDSLSALQEISSSGKHKEARFGVAFNPYLPADEMMLERKRLQQKVETGLVSTVYLQFGTDLKKLKTEITALVSNSRHQFKIVGSVFIPSRQFLAQFRFRPWRGVFCSEKYLNDIEYAMTFTQNLFRAYADLNIEPLVETALRKDSDVSLLRRLVGHDVTPTEIVGQDVMPTEIVDSATEKSTDISTCILLYTCFDLRVHDHPALNASCRDFDEVIPLFLWNSEPQTEAEYSGFNVRPFVSEIWIHESLKDLERSLKKMNAGLVLRNKSKGVVQSLKKLICDIESLDERRKVRAIYTGTRFEPHARHQDKIWADTLRRESKVDVKFFNTSLLYDPKKVQRVEKTCTFLVVCFECNFLFRVFVSFFEWKL